MASANEIVIGSYVEGSARGAARGAPVGIKNFPISADLHVRQKSKPE